jgi:hypothetical protein
MSCATVKQSEVTGSTSFSGGSGVGVFKTAKSCKIQIAMFS